MLKQSELEPENRTGSKAATSHSLPGRAVTSAYYVGPQHLREFNAAPESVQAAFWQQLGAEVKAECDFDIWLAAVESDDLVSPAAPSTTLRRRALRWDAHWTKRAARAKRRRTPELAFPKEDFLEISAIEYVPVLTDEDVVSGRPIPCPLPGHDERTPSFSVYPEQRGWYCFGCHRGGDIFVLAGLLWGIDHTESGFDEICRRLGGIFA